MKHLTLEQKALRVIEWMVSDDASEQASYDYTMNRPINQEDSRIIAGKIGEIYTFSHSVNPENICYDVHDGWRSKVLSLYNKLHRKKLV